jgi:hypothetical protein
LQLQENANAAIEILLAVCDLPTIQDHAQFLLRFPNGCSCPRPILLHPHKRLKRRSNLGLNALPRGSRISYPPRRNVRSEFQKAADGRSSARGKQFSFSRHAISPLPLAAVSRPSCLLVRGWRQQAVKAEVYRCGAVMVGPVVGEGDQCESPWRFAAAPHLNCIAQLGVRYFRHRSVAELE